MPLVIALVFLALVGIFFGVMKALTSRSDWSPTSRPNEDARVAQVDKQEIIRKEGGVRMRYFEYAVAFTDGYVFRCTIRPSSATEEEIRKQAVAEHDNAVQRFKEKNAKAYAKMMKGVEKEEEPGAKRQALLSSVDPETVREAQEIRKQVEAALVKSNGAGQNVKTLRELLLINEYKPLPDGLGCYKSEEGWILYEVDESLNLWVKGPFSAKGIVSAITKTLGIPTGIAPLNFTTEETDLFLQKPKPIERYEADLAKRKKKK